MPDSTNLNTQARKQNTFDAIVVGSGITGGWAAMELCGKGLKVLMLERGRDLRHPNYPTATLDPWELPHRMHLSQEDMETHPVQSRHYSFREDNKHFYVDDLANPYDEVKRYDWIRGDILGGRSLLWARACYRWSDLDFEANMRDGHGVDWPVRYKQIAPWYSYVEKFVGVSGSKENLDVLPDGEFLPPFEMNCVEQDFKNRLEGKFNERKMIMGRSANLTQPLNGRGQCQARDKCHRGCPFGAYFSTNSATLPVALATGNLTVRPYSLVNHVIYDEAKAKASGVEILDMQTMKTENFYAPLIFLNASTVATAFILLNSTSNRFPNGLGNESDQVGRNLMDHHKGVSVNADVDGFMDKYYYGRRPVSAYIPRFRNVKKQDTDYLRGFNIGVNASRNRRVDIPSFGAEMKEALTEPGAWSVGMYAFGECLPYNDNRITLNKEQKDKWGLPLIAISCEFKNNEKKMHEDMTSSCAEMLESVGYKNVHASSQISFPGNANHEMGIARMGKDPKTSVLNSYNQMHEVKNVFITDGSAMASCSHVNPSLTYMAFTARACDYALKELKKGNI